MTSFQQEHEGGEVMATARMRGDQLPRRPLTHRSAESRTEPRFTTICGPSSARSHRIKSIHALAPLLAHTPHEGATNPQPHHPGCGMKLRLRVGEPDAPHARAKHKILCQRPRHLARRPPCARRMKAPLHTTAWGRAETNASAKQPRLCLCWSMRMADAPSSAGFAA